MTKVSIRVATEDDLPALKEVFDQGFFFAERLERQRHGRGELRLAFWRQVLVGDIYLWWEPAQEAELQAALPGVPLLQHLEVRDSYRNRGIGRALVADAEVRLLEDGHNRVALGVDLVNHDAARLYKRLGYTVWRQQPILTVREQFHPDGSRSVTPEWCRIYVKDLVAIRET